MKPKITDQIDCGYCKRETTCEIRDPKINKAKLGCKEFEHHLHHLIQNNHGKIK